MSLNNEISFNYKDENGNSQVAKIADPNLIADIAKAESDISTAKKYYEETFYPLWREGYKMYHLSTADRQSRIKKWQHNAAFGMVRSITDVFASSLTEKPITFNVTGINKKGRENAENIRNALAFAADATGFQEEVKESLKEALKTGTFAADLNYIDPKKGRTYTVYNEKADPTEQLKQVPFDDDEISEVPKATHLSVFSFFADPYNGNNPTYFCRRKLLDAKTFEEIFGKMIDSNQNSSPLKSLKAILVKNKNGASFLDHTTIVDQIHRERASYAQSRDSYITVNEGSVNSLVGNILSFSEQREDAGVIEAILYERADKIILKANNYPVCIMDNPYGFIKAEVQSATSAKRGTDCEGVSYIIGDLARLFDGFGNSFVDNVRSVADPTFIGIQGSFVDEESIKELEPGEIYWAQDKVGAESLRRMDKGGVSDFGMSEFILAVATRLIGTSDYDYGIAARERTATGALAVSQSSARRLSPFMQNFVSFISRIAYKWLMIIKNEWTQAKYVTVTDSDTDMEISNVGLQGAVLITLEMDSMISAINEFAYKKLIEIEREFKGTGIVNENEIGKEIFRSLGLSPSRFVPDAAPNVTNPNPIPPGPEAATPDFIPTDAQQTGMDIQQFSTPQIPG